MLTKYAYTHIHTQPLNTLDSEADEVKVSQVLDRLRNEVKKRRLMLYPYFRDFDRVSGLITVSSRSDLGYI